MQNIKSLPKISGCKKQFEDNMELQFMDINICIGIINTKFRTLGTSKGKKQGNEIRKRSSKGFNYIYLKLLFLMEIKSKGYTIKC